ncbi:hypothetical protein NZL82_04960 [Sphingomonas sanguinis]|uniref:hypothetical protein n=1 Tax=Sphingomonas sp. LC-1 TaxID=3110957 RepID=UPI0021BAF862|nr:hypothetical protein [Sphingomonas sp. LC-1]MCT8001225.1 hypothetical protein [Sphingomonas sp. LC-1]
MKQTCPHCGADRPDRVERFGLAVQRAPGAVYWKGVGHHRLAASGVSNNWPREDFNTAMKWLRTQVDAGSVEFVITVTLAARYGNATVPAWSAGPH